MTTNDLSAAEEMALELQRHARQLAGFQVNDVHIGNRAAATIRELMDEVSELREALEYSRTAGDKMFNDGFIVGVTRDDWIEDLRDYIKETKGN